METETQEGYICIPKEIFIDGEYNLLTAEARGIFYPQSNYENAWN